MEPYYDFFAHAYPSGAFTHFVSHPWSLTLYDPNVLRQAFAVRLVVNPDGAYWGWLAKGNSRPSMIWANELSFRACFPYKLEVHEASGEGKIVRFSLGSFYPLTAKERGAKQHDEVPAFLFEKELFDRACLSREAYQLSEIDVQSFALRVGMTKEDALFLMDALGIGRSVNEICKDDAGAMSKVLDEARRSGALRAPDPVSQAVNSLRLSGIDARQSLRGSKDALIADATIQDQTNKE